MKDREEVLGRTLRALLREETATMQIDTQSAAQRLERQLDQERSRRRATVGLAAAAAILVTAVGGLFWAVQSGDGDSPGPVDVVPPPMVGEPYYLDVASGARAAVPADLAEVMDRARITYSPDGAKIAYVCLDGSGACPGEAAGTTVMVVANADGSDPVAHPLPPGALAFSPVWTPDGATLVYQQITADNNVGNIFLMDVGSGETTQVTDLALTGSYWDDNLRLAVSPGGATILFHRPRTADQDTGWDIWSVPVTGGEESLVLRDAVYPTYLADGTIISVAPGSTAFDGRRITIRNPDGSRRTLASTTSGIFNLEISPDTSQVIAFTDTGDPRVIDTVIGKAAPLDIDGDAVWADSETLAVSAPGG